MTTSKRVTEAKNGLKLKFKRLKDNYKLDLEVLRFEESMLKILPESLQDYTFFRSYGVTKKAISYEMQYNYSNICFAMLQLQKLPQLVAAGWDMEEITCQRSACVSLLPEELLTKYEGATWEDFNLQINADNTFINVITWWRHPELTGYIKINVVINFPSAKDWKALFQGNNYINWAGINNISVMLNVTSAHVSLYDTLTNFFVEIATQLESALVDGKLFRRF